MRTGLLEGCGAVPDREGANPWRTTIATPHARCLLHKHLRAGFLITLLLITLPLFSRRCKESYSEEILLLSAPLLTEKPTKPGIG